MAFLNCQDGTAAPAAADAVGEVEWSVPSGAILCVMST
jgi:hypothetical protein